MSAFVQFVLFTSYRVLKRFKRSGQNRSRKVGEWIGLWTLKSKYDQDKVGLWPRRKNLLLGLNFIFILVLSPGGSILATISILKIKQFSSNSYTQDKASITPAHREPILIQELFRTSTNHISIANKWMVYGKRSGQSHQQILHDFHFTCMYLED